MANISARELALKVLYKVEKENAYSNIALDEELNKNKLDAKDIGLASEIVYGTITWKITLDEIIKKYSKIKLNKISIWILNILRTGIYQILFLDKVPKSAVVNEAVKLAKRYGHNASSGFVNAILRKVSKQDFDELNNIKDICKRLSVTTSHPEWLVKRCLEEFDEEFVSNLFVDNNKTAENTLRVNTLQISREELIEKLEAKGINCKKGMLESTIYVSNLKNVAHLKEFKEGLFIMQDEVATLASVVLNPKEGENVLDACAAPGGKTTHLAQIMENKGQITAWDLYVHRVKLIEENYERLGINIIKAEEKDATQFDQNLENKFDKILLDAPCSGLGVIRRKPDIKYQRKEEDIGQIKDLQIKILNNVCKYLKLGGEMVYSTCTILKEENEEIVEEFLKAHKEFKLVNIEKEVPENFKNSVCEGKYLKLYPNINKTDGFFICKLSKVNC